MEFGDFGLRKITAEEKELYTRKGYWENITIGDLFDRAVLDFPNNLALACPEENISWSYSELNEQVYQTAITLLEAGLKKGDNAIIQLPNVSDFVVIFLALQKIGVTPIPSIPRHGLAEIEHFCNAGKAAAWFVPLEYGNTSYRNIIDSLKGSYPQVKIFIVGEGEIEGAGNLKILKATVKKEKCSKEELENYRPDPEKNLAYLMPTGGTTGLSKLVAHNHNTLICHFRSIGRAMGCNSFDNVLIATPVGHNQALTLIIAAVGAGSKITMIKSTRAEDILRCFEDEKITRTILVPTQYTDILNVDGVGSYDLSSISCVATGAAHCPPEVARSVCSLINDRLMNIYGISEGGTNTTRTYDPLETILYTQGIPCAGLDQRKLVDEQGNDVATGEEGELLIKGPDTFLGYFEAEKDNRNVFTAEGFYHTGDLARIDALGNLTITGRKKDVIIRGGESIPVTDIENKIISHPAVKQVAVVAMPDPRLGEKICAYLELKPGSAPLTLEEVTEYLENKGCSRSMLPERLELIEAMPLTGAGKIDKKYLRSLLQ